MKLWATICGWLGKQRQETRVVASPSVPKAGAWTAHDRDTLRHFLSTDIGIKLVARLHATEYSLAVANAQNTSNTIYAAGVTTGYNHALRHLVSLSYSCEMPSEKNEQTQDREYLERVSP